MFYHSHSQLRERKSSLLNPSLQEASYKRCQVHWCGWLWSLKSKSFTISSSHCYFHKTNEILKNSVRVLPHTQTEKKLNSFFFFFFLMNGSCIPAVGFHIVTLEETLPLGPKAKWDKMLTHSVNIKHESDGKASQPVRQSVSGSYQVWSRYLQRDRATEDKTLSSRSDNAVRARTHTSIVVWECTHEFMLAVNAGCPI